MSGWGSHQQPVGTDVLEAKIVVLLDVVEVAVDEEAVVGELVIVHDVLLIYLVDNIGVFKVQKS